MSLVPFLPLRLTFNSTKTHEQLLSKYDHHFHYIHLKLNVWPTKKLSLTFFDHHNFELLSMTFLNIRLCQLSLQSNQRQDKSIEPLNDLPISILPQISLGPINDMLLGLQTEFMSQLQCCYRLIILPLNTIWNHYNHIRNPWRLTHKSWRTPLVVTNR